MERGKIDPRVSNLVQLARVLNLEPMLVPKQWVGFVHGLQAGDRRDTASRPAYTLDDEDYG